MIKRAVAVVVLALALAGGLGALAQPAQARKLPPLIGCGSPIEWPCPGPAL